MTQDYKPLMAALDAELRDGPQTTRALKAAHRDYPEWQVMNCIKYLGAVTVPGRHKFDPHTVYHPDDPDRPVPPIDAMLGAYFDEADPRTAIDTLDAVEAAGFTAAEAKVAFKRLGIDAYRRGRSWIRSRKAADEMVEATTADEAPALDVHSPAAVEVAAKAVAAVLAPIPMPLRAIETTVAKAHPDMTAEDVAERVRIGLGHLTGTGAAFTAQVAGETRYAAGDLDE